MADTEVRYLDYPTLAPRTIPAHYCAREPRDGIRDHDD
jgi:hypothetical protein